LTEKPYARGESLITKFFVILVKFRWENLYFL